MERDALIEYELGVGRAVRVEFLAEGGVRVRETFASEDSHSIAQQREGWQAILDNFARHVAAAA